MLSERQKHASTPVVVTKDNLKTEKRKGKLISTYLLVLINFACLYMNIKLEFIQKDIFLFKISYISVCSKTFLKLYI